MKKLIVLLITLLLLAGCTKEITKTSNKETCKELADRLDSIIVDINNPPGTYRILGTGVVGGVLTKKDFPVFYSGEGVNKVWDLKVHKLTFQGNKKSGELFLYTVEDANLPYEIGKFYKFDLSNIDKFSQRSGSFVDMELNKLEQLECD